jgi:hypothetical protein
MVQDLFYFSFWREFFLPVYEDPYLLLEYIMWSQRDVVYLGALVYEPNEYSCAHGHQTNFGDLTPYLPMDCTLIKKKEKFSSNIKKFRGIGCKKSYITNGHICLGNPFLIYDFAPDPF